jgi:pyruvate/2-oxoglutarate dehydrogenase complex dihydrolipoamide dehydrogenase (E3) component
MADLPLLITPLDEPNQRLVDAVHPSEWVNPDARPTYHLVVLGGGTAGLVAAATVAGLGGNVALVERHLLGGDRLIAGCVPSKGVLRAARAWHEAAAAAPMGLRVESAQRDFGAAMKRMRSLRAAIAPNDSAARLRELGIDVFLGHGRFVAADAVAVDGTRLVFHRALVATGSRPAVPDVPGLSDAGFLTSESVFTLQNLPPRLAVVGGGPAGCELAQAFARFGAQVTQLVREERLLPREDPETAAEIRGALERDGVRVVAGAVLRGVERSGRSKHLRFAVGEDEHRLGVDEILVVIGREPVVEDLGLESAGVALGTNGIEADAHLRTTNPRIYAAGDCCTGRRYTHAADAMARIVVRNAFFGGREDYSRHVIPRCTYTSPEAAHTGATAAELAARGIPFETITVPLADNDRAVLDGAPEGFLRVHHRKGKDEILGATLVAEHAGETITELTAAIEHGIGLEKLAATIHPYPTQAAVVQKAGELYRHKRLTPLRRKLLALWFRRLETKSRKELERGATAAATSQVQG